MKKKPRGKKKEEDLSKSGDQVCSKCDNLMILEDEEWLCPHCQGEIDFMGGDDD